MQLPRNGRTHVIVEEKQLARQGKHQESIYFDGNDGKRKEKVGETCKGYTIL